MSMISDSASRARKPAKLFEKCRPPQSKSLDLNHERVG